MINSKGQHKSMFCINEVNKPKIFGVETSEKRADEIRQAYRKACDGWHPKATNAFELYLKAGNDWKKIDPRKIEKKDKLDWSGMPQAAIDYINSIPEFNAEMFKEITGIDASNDDRLD